jgi:2-methylcitrate dehydratase PrpD
MTLAERVAEFAAGLEFDDLPADVVTSVRLRTLDILGIALASSTSELAPSVLGALKGWGGGACSVVGSSLTAAPPLAALANGALAHGLDFDDTHAVSIMHASSVILPTVLALGEAGGHDGRSVVTAAVAGYEAMTRIGMAAPGEFHARGWHATAVCGTFGATVAAGRLEGLDRGRLTAALGIAGSFASGIIEHLEDGSWVKRVHPGWAAHSGVVAAGLARGGFTGPATILEGRFGFYRTFLRSEFDRTLFDTLGKEWETLRVGFKPYPCCHYNHAYLDCALALRREHGIEPDAIVAIECRVPAGEVPIVCEPRESKLRPRTTYDAQFSLAYSASASTPIRRTGFATSAPSRLPPGSSTPWTPPRASPTDFQDGSGFASATAGWSRHGSPTGAGAQSDRWNPRRSSPSSVTTPGARSRLTAWR